MTIEAAHRGAIARTTKPRMTMRPPMTGGLIAAAGAG
jgi:hypothetical protein